MNSEEIYKLLEQVPAGKVTTYKALAHALGSRAYRAVGSAMRCNPYAPRVPCHRVVRSDGSLGRFKGKKKAIAEKIDLLAKEGVHVEEGKIVDFAEKLYEF